MVLALWPGMVPLSLGKSARYVGQKVSCMETNSRVAVPVLVRVTKTRFEETEESVKRTSPSFPADKNPHAVRPKTPPPTTKRILLVRLMFWLCWVYSRPPSPGERNRENYLR